MITVLLLAAAEKLINLALRSDQITLAGLTPLSGKVLCIVMDMPAFSIDILFNDDHIRFEPVTTNSRDDFNAMFEKPNSADNQAWQQAAMGHTLPDCTIHVANPAELLNLLRAPKGNLPIDGDYKVLMQVKQLVAGFDPDIAGQLEPLIGGPLASQLGMLINSLKGSMSHSAKHTFNDVADWANDVAGNTAVDPEIQAESNELQQRLLQLRADVEREEARLAAIKAEQVRLRGKR